MKEVVLFYFHKSPKARGKIVEQPLKIEQPLGKYNGENMKLREHQAKALSELKPILDKWSVAFLSGEQRTGKTAVAAAISKHVGGQTLVVTKKAAIEGILGDFKAMGCGDTVTCVNYEALHKLETQKWKLIICDEVHAKISSFPKESQTYKKLQTIFKNSGAKGLLMSGTAAMESRAQLYHEFCVTCRGPWAHYESFYTWYNPEYHYAKRDKYCGSYGVYGAVNTYGKDYSKVHDDKILADIKRYTVKMTREEAGYDVVNSTVIPVELENDVLAHIGKVIAKEKIIKVTDSEGKQRTCVYDGPAQVLQGRHMIGGGTLIDDEGEAFVLGEDYKPDYRLAWMSKGMKKDCTYVILTAYIKEREFIKAYLGNTHETLEELKAAGSGCFVGSLSTLAEGVDLSWLTGSQILYSLSWSGSKFSQVCDRQLNAKRKTAAKVAVPLLKGGVCGKVLQAVQGKNNFNNTFYKAIGE